jgi:hypothetical protein
MERRHCLVGLSLVQRHRDYLCNALAMKSNPRMFVEARVANFDAGHPVEKVAAMFANLDAKEAADYPLLPGMAYAARQHGMISAPSASTGGA